MNKKTLVIINKNNYKELDLYVNKLKELLHLASYDIINNSIDIIDYSEYNISNHSNQYKSIICFDNIYVDISKLYSDQLEVPFFEFSLNNYFEKTFNILLYGFPYSIEDIYKTENKKDAWKSLKNFVLTFNKLDFNKSSFTFKTENTNNQIVEISSPIVDTICVNIKENASICVDNNEYPPNSINLEEVNTVIYPLGINLVTKQELNTLIDSFKNILTILENVNQRVQ